MEEQTAFLIRICKQCFQEYVIVVRDGRRIPQICSRCAADNVVQIAREHLFAGAAS